MFSFFLFSQLSQRVGHYFPFISLLLMSLGNSVWAQTQAETAQSNVLFNWAETQYSSLFSPTATTQNISGYLVRYYSATDAWLGTKDGQVYVYGAAFNDFAPAGLTIKSIGDTSTFLNLARANSSLVINEIVAKDANDGDDWFELYVTGTSSINLSEYTIVDDDADHTPAALPNVTLNPGQYLVIYATDDERTDGAATVPFKLGSADSLSLFKNGVLVDYLAWEEGEAASGFSYGLSPDGTGTAGTLTPTQGATNGTTTSSSTVTTTSTDSSTTSSSKAENKAARSTVFKTDEVRNVYIEIADTDWQAILSNPTAEEYKTASITYNGTTVSNVAFRTKGNSSLNNVSRTGSARYSFKVDMNYYVDGQKLFGFKKLNFNNNYSDPSYMRETLSYQLMEKMGLPTPRWSYVNLYVNGELRGLYTMVEQVDSEFLEDNFANDDGDLYKAGERSTNLSWAGSEFSAYNGMELKTNEDTSDNSAFIHMVDVLNNGTDYESVLDVDEVLRYFAVSTALTNLDSYQGSMLHNYYLYEENGVFSVIPWDFNMSFGGFSAGCTSSEMLSFMIDEPTSSTLSDRPLIAKLLQNPTYLAKYHEYYEELINGAFSVATMTSSINTLAALIREHVAADPTAFYSIEQFEASLISGVTTTTTTTTTSTTTNNNGGGMTASLGLLSFVEQRVASIRAQLDGTQAASGDGSGSCSGTDGTGGGATNPNGTTQPTFPNGTAPTGGTMPTRPSSSTSTTTTTTTATTSSST